MAGEFLTENASGGNLRFAQISHAPRRREVAMGLESAEIFRIVHGAMVAPAREKKPDIAGVLSFGRCDVGFGPRFSVATSSHDIPSCQCTRTHDAGRSTGSFDAYARGRRAAF